MPCERDWLKKRVKIFYNGEESMELLENYAVLELTEGTDLTELLGILKWEKPMNAQLQGVCRGNFPSFIRKTDQERCQNLVKEIKKSFDTEDEFEVTIKLDGSSMTVYHNTLYFRGEDFEPSWEINIGVCSRNLDLKIDQEGNSFVNLAKESGLLDALTRLGANIAIQGELCGPSIQGNNEGLKENKFFVYDIFDIDTQSYVSAEHRYVILADLYDLGVSQRFVGHVPVLDAQAVLNTSEIDALLLEAEGKNEIGNEREGLVFKRLDGKFSFKVISNKFLLSEK